MNISTILKGCRPGKMQSVGVMQVIPLIMEREDQDFEYLPPDNNIFVSTTDYGVVRFDRENSDYTVVVPPGSSFLTKKKSQDHAVCNYGVIDKDSYIDPTAACIEQEQGGYLELEQVKIRMIPYAIRENMFENAKGKSCSKIWDAIEAFNKSNGINDRRSHMSFYYDSFDKELETFVAEFENVENQVGAIVLINDKVAGIEKTPNSVYWDSIWESLIRDCYGSLALQNKNKKPSSREKIEKISSLSNLVEAIKKVNKKEYDNVKEIVNMITSQEVDEKEFRKFSKLKTFRIGENTNTFKGEIIKESKNIIFATIVATDVFRKDQKFLQKSEFEM